MGPLLSILFALVVASVLAFIFANRWSTPEGQTDSLHGGLTWFFILVFLIIWAGGLWIVPFGPLAFGIPWLPYIFIGLIIALLFLAVVPGGESPNKGQANRRVSIKPDFSESEQKSELRTWSSFNVFFWITVALLLSAIIIRIINLS